MYDELIDNEIEEIEEDVVSSVIFTLKTDGTVETYVDWTEDDSYAEVIGAFFYEINRGSYGEDITTFLANHIEQNPQDAQFLLRLMKTWRAANELTGEITGEDQPLVPALRTFGASRVPGGNE